MLSKIFCSGIFIENLIPVMVWFHGGGLTTGSGSPQEYGPRYWMDDGAVVLVSINYRLNVFGFFSLGNDEVPGNQGLRDQQLALSWIKEQNGTFNHFIGGEFVKAKNHFKTKNPANNQFLANIAVGSKSDVNLAVNSALKAQKKWIQIGCHGRSRYLYAIARLLQKHSRLFAVLETIDNGKPIRESRDIDIPPGKRHFY